MSGIASKLLWRSEVLAKMIANQQNALEGATLELCRDLKESGTMPYDSGVLQDEQTFVDTTEKKHNRMRVVCNTAYATKIYYHPQLNFQKDVNEDAGGLWFEPYIGGEKQSLLVERYKEIVK